MCVYVSFITTHVLEDNLHLFIYVGWGQANHSSSEGLKGQLSGVGSLLQSCGSWESNSVSLGGQHLYVLGHLAGLSRSFLSIRLVQSLTEALRIAVSKVDDTPCPVEFTLQWMREEQLQTEE